MEDTCKVLARIVVILGIIGTLVMVFVFGRDVSIGYFGYTETEWNFWKILIVLVSGATATTLQATVFFALGEILENLRNVKFMLSAVDNRFEDSKLQKGESNGQSWKCATCGKVNSNLVGTCACGQSKSANS